MLPALKRERLEQYQLLVYLAAIGCGLIVGMALPGARSVLEAGLRPVLGLLLYATFTQVPLTHVRDALADGRFVLAAVIGNFLIVPVMVYGAMHLLPADPAIRFGVLLVLLVPCTDWFITFTHLGGGDTRHAIAFSPISLLLQVVLLPLYLWLFLGQTFVITAARQEMLVSFVTLILLPLAAAFITERWVERRAERDRLLECLAWCPIPLLAVVVFVIAATQVYLVADSYEVLGGLLVIYVAYLAAAALAARVLAGWFRLPALQGRVMAFSLGTRNSFVVLPLALALPPIYAVATVAIVFQSLVELLGMVAYLWLVPRVLFPASSEASLRGNTTGNTLHP